MHLSHAPANSISSRATGVWLLLLVTVVTYANSFAGVFLFDDHAAVLDDPRLGSFGAFRASIGQAIRPFAKATFLIDRSWYGNRPAGYHILNLLLHLACGLLLYRILIHSAFGERVRPEDASRMRGVAFWTTLLFLLHPIGTETVTYVSGRPTGLMTCGYLAAFLLFLEARVSEPGSSRQQAMSVSASVCLTLSLLAKEAAVVFPAMLLLYEAVMRRPAATRVGGGAVIRVHALMAAGVLVFLSWAAFHARYVFLFEYSLALRGWYENLLTQANAVVYAITLFIRPGQLNFEHDLPIYTSISQGPTLLSLAVLACLLTGAIALARRVPLVSFGVLWFLLHLLPTNSILARHDVLSERNLYLPSIGLYLAATAAVITGKQWVGARLRTGDDPASRPARLRPIAVRSAMALFVFTLVVVTASRNALYGDAVTFWSDAVAKSPRKARPHTNLGQAWFMAGDLDQSIQQFRVALTLDPLDAVAQRNLLEAWTRKTQSGAQLSR